MLNDENVFRILIGLINICCRRCKLQDVSVEGIIELNQIMVQVYPKSNAFKGDH